MVHEGRCGAQEGNCRAGGRRGGARLAVDGAGEEAEVGECAMRDGGGLHDGSVVRGRTCAPTFKDSIVADDVGRWEEDAEARCENLVTEALLVAPNTPEPFQTLASVRISQVRLQEANAALSRSMELWRDLPPEDPGVPDFPTRISLSRLLMEAEMEEEALEVLERLVGEDDSSVEAWYLGGWCLFLMSETRNGEGLDEARTVGDEDEDRGALRSSSREWLQHSLKLYKVLDYEDDRLRDHALELVSGLDAELGQVAEEEAGEGSGEEDWEDEVEDGDVDEEMNDI